MKKFLAILLSLSMAVTLFAFFSVNADSADLLNWEPAADDDSWSSSAPGKFWGPLQAPDSNGAEGPYVAVDEDGNFVGGRRLVEETTLSDGSTGPAVHQYLVAASGYRCGGNMMSLEGYGIEAGKKYEVSVVYKLTKGYQNLETVLAYGESDAIAASTSLDGTTGWTTLKLKFKAATATSPMLYVGPPGPVGHVSAGYDLWIEDINLVEATPADGDMLDWEPAAQDDSWSARVPGEFWGPNQAPGDDVPNTAVDENNNPIGGRRLVETTTLSDGSQGPAVHQYLKGKTGIRCGGNMMSLEGYGIEAGKKYTFVLVYKMTRGEEYDPIKFAYLEGTDNQAVVAEKVLDEAADWTKVELSFEATSAEAPVLAVCPNASPYGTIGVGYDMWIESVKLYEGDAPAEPTVPDTPTGDVSVIAIAVLAVALVAVVVFTKKKVTE